MQIRKALEPPTISLFEGHIVRVVPVVNGNEKFCMSLDCDRWNLAQVVRFATEISPDDPSNELIANHSIIVWGCIGSPTVRIAFPHHDEVHSRPR
jgi:hypothetical protein